MLTLGIVNTYTKIKVLDAHYRAIARAAPVAHATGFNLALFDFPDLKKPQDTEESSVKTKKDDLTDFVVDKTTIGESGKYLQLLNEQGKFFVFDLPKKGFQAQFGTPIITTSHPAEHKKITARQIAEDLEQNKSYLILTGLGRKGLPNSLFNLSPHHFDVTEQNISLETCTAIAAIPFTINTHRKLIRRERA